jgi:outer membrane protein TolC
MNDTSMETKRLRARTAAATCLAAALLAGCAGVPDARQMGQIREDAAEARLAALETRGTPGERGECLSGPLSLAEALEKGLAMNLSLQRETLEREIAAGKIQSAMQNALPSLSATGGYTRLDDELWRENDDGTRTRGRFADRYAAGLRIAQPLFNGHIAAAIRAARLYREWAEARIRDAEEAVRCDVVAAYCRAVLHGHLLQVQVSALETAQRQLDDALVRRREGMASHYDVLRATVEVSNFKAQVLQAQNERDLSFTELFRLIGASPESRVELTDPLPLVKETISFPDALRTALARRADLAVAEYAVRLQREAVRNAVGDYFPAVEIFATESWGNPDPHDASRDEWDDEWTAGLQFSWTLFDGFGRRGAVHQQQAALRQQELALQDAEESVVSTIRQLVLSLQTAEEFAESQSRNLETAREALRLVEVGLREGQNTQVEVMDARRALTTASANYYQSIYDHAMVRVSLLRAMGTLAESPDPSVPVFPAAPEPGPDTEPEPAP